MTKLSDDVLRKWHSAANFYWDETSHRCTNEPCGVEFATGDVCFLYGDLDSAVARKDYLCPRCGMVAVYDNRFPAATTLFIEDAHRNKRLSKLPKEIRERVVEGLAIIDEIHKGVEERLAAILDQNAKREEPS